MSNFRVGQIVVCVDDSPGFHFGDNSLVLHRVYVIRGLDERPTYELGCWLEELVDERRLPGMPDWEPSWLASRFRPVQPTSIAWAHKLVADLPKLDKRTKVSP